MKTLTVAMCFSSWLKVYLCWS